MRRVGARRIVIPVARKPLEGIEAEKFVERMLRVLMKVPSSKRSALWRAFILKQPKYLRERFMSIRSKRARIRKSIRDGVINAVDLVHKDFPAFRGVLFFGSFAEAREKGNVNFDLDVVPIVIGSGRNYLDPTAYDLLSSAVFANTQVKLHGLEMFVSHGGQLRKTLTALEISNVRKAKRQVANMKRFGFVNQPTSKVIFASYNFFGDEVVRQRLAKILD